MKVAHSRLNGPESGTATVTVEPGKRKFLHKLGIETYHHDESRSQSPPRTTTTTKQRTAVGTRISPPAADGNGPAFERDEWARPRVKNVVSMEEPLKYDNRRVKKNVGDSSASDHDSPGALKRRKTGSPDAAGTRLVKRCTFNESVQVIPIPMRSEYSHSVRSRLWAGAKEIQEMAARNTIEFASEGWDWRTVTLDESMYICRATGELIHPVHYEMQHNCFPAYYHQYYQS